MDFVALSKKYDLKETPIKGCYGNYTFSIFMAIFLRFLYVLHGMLLLHMVTSKWGPYCLNYFNAFLVAIIIEGFYVVFMRRGRESKYFSLCLYLYIFACTPAFWVLHFKRQPYIFHDLVNKSTEASLFTITGSYNFTHDDDIAFRVNENVFLALIVLSRWFLPKDDLNREDSYALIISNLSMAADAHEIIYSADNLNVFKRRYEFFQRFMLVTWTLSLPLFAINTSSESYGGKKFRLWSHRHLEKIFGNFYWKYLISMFLMDGPYFLVRMIGVIEYQIIGYQNILYIFKNGIQIIIQIYSILGKIFFPEPSDLYEQNLPKLIIDKKKPLVTLVKNETNTVMIKNEAKTE